MYRLCAFADEAGNRKDEQISALKRNGIGLIEVRNVDNKNVADLTKSEAKELRERLSTEGIGVWSVGSPIGKVDINSDLKAHFESFKAAFEVGVVLGAKAFRLFSFYGTKNNPEAYFDTVTDFLASAGKYVKGSGITLCHENEHGIFGENADDCVKILEAVPEVRAVFDPANFVLDGEDTLKAWEKLKKYVMYLHIKDALPERVVPAGEGMGNVGFIIRDFGMSGGEVLTYEPHLSHFVGLSSLSCEENKAVGGYNFGSNAEAFDYGAKVLKTLINKIEG